MYSTSSKLQPVVAPEFLLGKLGLMETKTSGANYCVYGEGAGAVGGFVTSRSTHSRLPCFPQTHPAQQSNIK